MPDSVFTLPDDMSATFEIVEEDAYGNVTETIAAVPTVSSSDPAILTATSAADGTFTVESPSGKLGTAQVTATLDPGSGKPVLTAIQSFEVVAGSATQLGFKQVGELTPKTATAPAPAPVEPTADPNAPPAMPPV